MQLRSNITDAKFVPFTAVEWTEIQRLFRSNNVNDLKTVCEILNMWKCRMGHSTPIFIDISELILSSIMLDKSSYGEFNNDGITDGNNIRLIYGSVIIRFINYVNEICQPDGSKLLSIATAVSELGIPAWIVNVRHEATHCQMPPLNIMREALMFCRDWLWRHQWIHKFSDAVKELPRELFEIERAHRHSAIVRRISNVFDLYHNWRKRDSTTRILIQEQREQSPFKQIIGYLSTHTEEFLQIFVETCLSTRITKKKNWSQCAVLSQDEQLYYCPILQLIHDKNILSVLLLEITKHISDSSTDHEVRFMLSGWADNLLVAFLQDGSPRFAMVSDQTWKLILKHVVLAPKYFDKEQTAKILLYMKNKIPQRSYKRITKLLEIGTKLFDTSLVTDGNENFDLSTYSIMTVSDLQNKIICNTTFDKDPLTGEEDWSLADMDYLGPLGLTSDQSAETLDLELGKAR